MAAIKSIHYADDYDWAGAGSLNWNQISDFTADGLEPGVEEPVAVEYGDGAEEQDGVRLQGEFKATGATLPSPGTRTWIRFTMKDGTAVVVGGPNGCRIQRGDAAVRPLGGGPAYKLIRYTATASNGGDLIEDDVS